jgi:hypothetical protein
LQTAWGRHRRNAIAWRPDAFELTLSETGSISQSCGARCGKADGRMMRGSIPIVNEMEF